MRPPVTVSEVVPSIRKAQLLVGLSVRIAAPCGAAARATGALSDAPMAFTQTIIDIIHTFANFVCLIPTLPIIDVASRARLSARG